VETHKNRMLESGYAKNELFFHLAISTAAAVPVLIFPHGTSLPRSRVAASDENPRKCRVPEPHLAVHDGARLHWKPLPSGTSGAALPMVVPFLFFFSSSVSTPSNSPSSPYDSVEYSVAAVGRLLSPLLGSLGDRIHSTADNLFHCHG